MGFLHGQETLSNLDWILRAIIAFFFLLAVAKILGQRSISQLRLLDFAITLVIVQNGEILYKGLKKARISIDILLEELREEKVDDVKKVALATWEPNGKFSVFLYPEYEPITPSSLHLETEPFDLPKTIIKEGKINFKELKECHKDNLKVFLYK